MIAPYQPYQKYTEFIKEILENDELFATFKRNPIYNDVLEHVTCMQGVEYLEHILYANLPREVWEQVLQNDLIGNPNRFSYFVPYNENDDDKKSITYKPISPTTLRYFKFSIDILNNKTLDLKHSDSGINVVEIGGGYGGFCKVFLDLCHHYDVKVNSYTIIDIEYPVKLIKKYLNTVEHKPCDIKVMTIEEYQNQNNENQRYDLFLSMYCYSEISMEYRKLYTETIVDKCDHGFLAWNDEVNDLDSIKKQLNKDNVIISEEEPKTGFFNKIVVF